MTRTNWAKNLTFSAEEVSVPETVEQVQEVVARSRAVHVVGTGHSFSPIADTTGTLITLERMPEHFELTGSSARVSAGIRLARLADLLHAHGFALPTLPSLPHITLAGTCVTATHGSGDGVASLASVVSAIELVGPDGDLRRLERGDPDFDGSVVALGALGVIVTMEIDVEPAFDVEQRVYQDVPWSALTDHFDTVHGSAYSVSSFTQYRGTAEVWVKRRLDAPPADLSWTGGHEATAPRHPVPGQPAHHCTAQLGDPGPWHERLPHFRAAFTPSVGTELQSEFFVAREHAAPALRALATLSTDFAPILLTSEVRTVNADAQWLSPVHNRPSVAFHFTWRQEAGAVAAVATKIEQALEPFTPRPHWGKVFTLNRTTLASRYPHWTDFAALLERTDPEGKFRNTTVNTWFPPTTT
ncbi:FAD-binding protein [Actinosynnema pretiosum subsp. pretiosum]|uniref:FAD-binding protein n=1 Tax=Actinosynnema pretiosum subsp. pretiosum TaxID=103721 RepID=A0AA45L9Z3_9PSEU|nr:xylitol oxidase [Actinosynnema pretiosum subsp. pretiosum]QUF06082.1 FAD-binding protein [Actinosynnema pretiosum subsp. pretiosum]